MIDISRLENIRHNSDGSIQSRCPACSNLLNRDKTGNHLRVYSDRVRYNCVAYSGDTEHNSLIYKLVGEDTDGNISYYVEPIDQKAPIYYSEDIVNKLVRNFSYWNERGVKNETMELFEGGLASVGKLNHRYVFVLRDKLNRIIGFSGRYIYPIKPKSGTVKYKILGRKNLAIFPTFSREFIKSQNEVILVEGVGCCFSLVQSNIKNIICLFGTDISPEILGILISLNPKKIIIATNNEPDNNNIGNDAAEDIKDKLSLFFNSENIEIRLPIKKDFLEMTCEEVRKWYKND